jgi:hypothetical protein
MLLRVRVWLVVFPVLVAGSEVAHSLVDLFAPRAYLGAEVFDPDSGRDGLVLPLAGLGVGLVVAALASGLTGRLRGRPELARTPGRLVAMTPLLLFLVQEHVEYAVGHGRVFLLVLRPAFLLGLLLQVPFAVAAWFAAALLLRLTAAIARRLDRGWTLGGSMGCGSRPRRLRPAGRPGVVGHGSPAGRPRSWSQAA